MSKCVCTHYIDVCIEQKRDACFIWILPLVRSLALIHLLASRASSFSFVIKVVFVVIFLFLRCVGFFFFSRLHLWNFLDFNIRRSFTTFNTLYFLLFLFHSFHLICCIYSQPTHWTRTVSLNSKCHQSQADFSLLSLRFVSFLSTKKTTLNKNKINTHTELWGFRHDVFDDATKLMLAEVLLSSFCFDRAFRFCH